MTQDSELNQRRRNIALSLVEISRHLSEDLVEDVASARVDLLHAAGLLLRVSKPECESV